MSLPEPVRVYLEFHEPAALSLLNTLLEARKEGRWTDESTALLNILAQAMCTFDLDEAVRAYKELMAYITNEEG